MKKVFIGLLVIVLVALGWMFWSKDSDTDTPTEDMMEDVAMRDRSEDTTSETNDEMVDQAVAAIGTSVNGAEIMKYSYGSGDTEVLFVGGVHGGYSWNTSLVAYELMDYLSDNEDDLAPNLKVTVVPVLNPDGLSKVVDANGKFSASAVDTTESARVAGRFNGNGVDLNRNFDCEWQSEGVWRDEPVDGGSAAFSEPESRAIRDYIESHDPAAVVVYYGAVGGVYASNCRGGVLAETRTLTNVYADASGYGAFEEFDYYEITGDMVNWLAGEGVPAISVLLTNYTDTEWSKNRAGVEAVLDFYADADAEVEGESENE